MKVVALANDDDPWTARRLVRLLNTLAQREVGYDALYMTEAEAEAKQKEAFGELPPNRRTITFTITSSEDGQ